MSKTALIVVDVQNDFCEGGTLAVNGGNKVAENIHNLLTLNKEIGIYDYVYATLDWHIDPGDHWSDTPDFIDSWPRHCEAGTQGSELHPVLNSDHFDQLFFKGQFSAAYSGFEGRDNPDINYSYWNNLNHYLENVTGVKKIDIAGLAFDYCVKSTALDAASYGYKTRVLTSYTAAVDKTKAFDVALELNRGGVWLS